MKRVYNNLLQEEYFKEVLDNGLTVVLCKRPSIKNATAMLTVKYGSLHQEFKYDGCDDIIKTPAGVAHFLEHKMFEMPNDVDACDLFAELGADVNFEKAIDLVVDNPFVVNQTAKSHSPFSRASSLVIDSLS